MNPQNKPQHPIGYWLKRADEVITGHVNRVLSEHQLTRFHWQLLNSVYESGSISRAELWENLQVFLDVAGLDEIIQDFVRRGWMTVRSTGEGQAELELTVEGREGHQTVFRLQSEVRKRAVEGVSQEEYMTVIRVLQRIVANLEPGA